MSVEKARDAFVSRRADVPTLVLAALLAAACGVPGTPVAPEPVPPPPPPPPRVVIVSIDGLRPEGLIQGGAANLVALARRGAYTWNAQTVMPSNTLPAHVSMLSGYPPAVHGVTWDEDRPERGPLTVATVFTAVRAAGLRAVAVVGKSKLAALRPQGPADSYVVAGRGDADVANEAVVQLGTAFALMFVHLPETDLVGHSKGWLSTQYLAQVSETDAAVGRILAALPPHTTVIVTADHGGVGRNHGSSIPVDMTIPWIAAGPRIAADRRLSGRVHTTDTAATAAFVLGLTLAPDAVGRPVLEAFTAAAASAPPHATH